MVYPNYDRFRRAYWQDEKGDTHPIAEMVDEDGVDFLTIYENTCVAIGEGSLLYSSVANFVTGHPILPVLFDMILGAY